MTVFLVLAALLTYNPSFSKSCVGDLSLPKKVDAATPAVLLIHGGGWCAMKRQDVDGIADFLRDDLGCAVYNIDYRLASAKNPWPACGDDCVKAAEFMFTDAFAAAAGMRPKKLWVHRRGVRGADPCENRMGTDPAKGPFYRPSGGSGTPSKTRLD